jgi:hypothetical protein
MYSTNRRNREQLLNSGEFQPRTGANKSKNRKTYMQGRGKHQFLQLQQKLGQEEEEMVQGKKGNSKKKNGRKDLKQMARIERS